jgi:hypothetical protein
MRLPVVGVALLLVAGCVTNPKYAMERTDVSCDRAVRVVHRTLVTMGYTVTRMDEPRGDQSGYVSGTKTNPDGSTSEGSVRIRCTSRGVEVQPVEGAAFSDFSFSRGFRYSFLSLVQRPDVESPIVQAGVQPLVERIDAFRARLDLDGPALAGDATLVRVTVRNGTDRAVALDAGDVTLTRASGAPASPLPTDAATRLLASGPGGDHVRAALLGHLDVPAKTTAVRFLLFPPAPDYRQAQLSLTDVETGEADGFSVPLE